MMEWTAEERRSNRQPASFRDPSGFLFSHRGRLFRQVNHSYKADYDRLMASGLYKKLRNKGWLIPHDEIESWPDNNSHCYKIIEPRRLPFISYPYEWCFSQLKDAALLTLNIQKESIGHGLVMKDASAYNIQFDKGRPVLIDTLSFSRYAEGEPWNAYRQFCMHFLAPLVLMSRKDVRLGRLSMLYMDGIPLDLANQLLSLKVKLKPGIFAHICLHARLQRRNSDLRPSLSGRISKNGMMGLLDSLEKTIMKLCWNPVRSQWANYYQATNYRESAFIEKMQIVRELAGELNPVTIWDFGANTGVFSRAVLENPKLNDCMVVSSDIDPGAVEINYLECKKQKSERIYPLLIDLTNPSSSIGWGNAERQSFYQRGPVDLILALAFIHHIVISNNVPLEDVARLCSNLCKYLIIEFVPKQDSQVKKILASRMDVFHDYTLDGFCTAFNRHFNLERKVAISGTDRTIFLFSNKTDPYEKAI
jgi:hypothetical protein